MMKRSLAIMTITSLLYGCGGGGGGGSSSSSGYATDTDSVTPGSANPIVNGPIPTGVNGGTFIGIMASHHDPLVVTSFHLSPTARMGSGENYFFLENNFSNISQKIEITQEVDFKSMKFSSGLHFGYADFEVSASKSSIYKMDVDLKEAKLGLKNTFKVGSLTITPKASLFTRSLEIGKNFLQQGLSFDIKAEAGENFKAGASFENAQTFMIEILAKF